MYTLNKIIAVIPPTSTKISLEKVTLLEKLVLIMHLIVWSQTGPLEKAPLS